MSNKGGHYVYENGKDVMAALHALLVRSEGDREQKRNG